MKQRLIGVVTVLALGLCLWPMTATAQKFVIKTLAEKKLQNLPEGPLYWRIETFPTLFHAEAAAGPTGLAAEAAGKVWLFTLGPQGGSTPGGSKVVEIGPVPPLAAPEYLLRIIQSGGPPGAKTPVHTHPGSEAFYVLAGEQTQRTPHGVTRLEVGQSMTGHGPDTPMEVSSNGTTDLDQDDRSGSVCDVPGGRHQAIHVPRGVSVSPAVILPAVRARCHWPRASQGDANV